MRVLLTILAVLVTSAAGASDLDGAWVLSGQWAGYMGLALKFRGDHYKYWFSSDVAPVTIEMTDEKGSLLYSHTEKSPRYPLAGRAVIRGDTLELRGPGHYYDRKWRRLTYHGVPCLLAEQHYVEWKKTGKLAEDRLLFRVRAFDERHPQLNYGGWEQPDGSVSRTSPLPPK
jgi:hypothetical protein